MFRSFIICCVLPLLAVPAAKAGDPVYPVSAIPDSLLTDAHAVKRLSETYFQVTASGEGRLTMREAITVLDAAGEPYARLVGYYSKFSSIQDIKGALYDANGKLVKRLKQSEIEDVNAAADGSMIDDSRIKRHTFYYNAYPYTVEYECEIRIKHTYFFPKWVPQEGEDMAVEQGRLTVNVPAGYTLRYRQFRYPGAPQVSEKGAVSYTWEIKHLKAWPEEALAPEWYRRTTAVWLAPSEFEMDRYKGSMRSWEEFGKFFHILNQGRDQLPEQVKQAVHQLTDGLPAKEKIAKLYRYLQQNTRYVSIQLGIGGLQPFDAAYVAGNRYGDCKALSNFMYALLKEAGIPSHYTLVHGGDGETSFVPDFPSDQFNHVILCVPQGRDTTWLECTSAWHPAGYLGNFTANRPALLITEHGGKLVYTPAYTMEQNLQVRRLDAQIDATGNLLMQVTTRYTGQQQDDLLGRIHMLSNEKLMEWARKSLPLPSYDVDKYACTEQPDAIPAISEQQAINARNYVNISGKRMFLEPNILSKSSFRIAKEDGRRSDIRLSFPYRDVDSVHIAIPEGYTPESLPKPVSLESRFGKYTSKVSIAGNTLTYIRTMERQAGTFPASAFSELEQFYGAIYKADRGRVVLVKNN